MKLLSTVVASLLFVSVLPAADTPSKENPAGVPRPKVEETRELLSEHVTVARLKQISFRRCMGLTALCPDRCGHSGDFAEFEIVSYLKYLKAGQYGDEKGTSFMFQIEDNQKNLKVSKELAETARALQPGDTVLLSWRHDYVTRKEDGGESKFPDRPITALKKIMREEADKLMKEAAK